MKNLILIALMLQLVITIKEINADYKFGDIIEFPRGCVTQKSTPIYKHYAIYVGPFEKGQKEGVDIGQGDNDIFHRTGGLNKVNCKFDKLETTKGQEKERKANYLDGIDDFTVGSPKDIQDRIIELTSQVNCKRYDLTSNNCEHMATYVRYNKPKSLQAGTTSACLINISKEAKDILEQVNKNRAVQNECEPGV